MKEKVLVGLSGGVDSAVAALLLQSQGYGVIGAFMKNYSDKKNALTGDCHWVEDKISAQKVASRLKIPFIVLDFEDEYKTEVIDAMFQDYEKGMTPNPDALCNSCIKFPLLWAQALKLGCSHIATGHYAIIEQNPEGFALIRAKDEVKDQTYFLYGLTQEELRHTIFPVGHLKKEEVRQIAKRQGLHNWDRKGTSGICFVGKTDLKQFLQQRIEPKEGVILTTEGRPVGRHQGVMFYTIGERIGPSIGCDIDKEFHNSSGKRIYVASKNVDSNSLIIAQDGEKALSKETFYLDDINWTAKRPAFPLEEVRVRIRHLGSLISATLESQDGRVFCRLSQGTRGLAEGQNAVIYQGKKVLGGGLIRTS